MTHEMSTNKPAGEPPFSSWHGCVYAVLFSDGWIKVGRGTSPNARIRSHQTLSAMRGAVLTNSIVSGPLVNASIAEARLIKECQAQGRAVHGREWFLGVDFDSLASIISEEFPGDAEDVLAEVRSRQEKGMEGIVDTLYGTKEQVAEAAAKQAYWHSSCSHARVLDSLLIKRGCNGPLFTTDESGLTPFAQRASVALFEMTESETADVYAGIAADPGREIDALMDRSQDIVREFVRETGAINGQG